MSPGVIGRYRIEGVLGKGGMAVVYAGWDADLQRKVAIKVLGDRGEEAGRARLLREARALAKLSHPNVVTVYEVGSDGERDFIAMELIEGVHLAEWLRRGPSQREVLRVFLEAGKGLVAAHDAGMIHRDFKPHNVLVRKDGRVVVTDFGIARLELGEPAEPRPPAMDQAIDPKLALTVPDSFPGGSVDPALLKTVLEANSNELTRPGSMMGTPGYMAPEQYGGVADARSDQFSFCVALWQGLSGAMPFEGASIGELLDAISSGPRGDLPKRLRAILARGLAADPEHRWPSMQALLSALEPRRVRAAKLAAIAGLLVVAGGAAAVAHTLSNESAPVTHADDTTTISGLKPAAPTRVLPRGEPRRITLDEGCEEFPSFAPDGRTLVYDAQFGSAYVIMTMDIESRRTRRLTEEGAWSYKPTVSPDGTMVAYLRNERDATSANIIPIKGGTPKHIAASRLQPVWSGDSRAVWVSTGERIDLISIADGSVLRTLQAPEHTTPGVGVQLPDGRVAFVMFPFQSDRSGSGVAIYDAQGRSTWWPADNLEETLAFAPTGDALIAAQCATAGRCELRRFPLTGEPSTMLPDDITVSVGLSISRGGDLVAWSDCAAKSHLATLSGHPLHFAPMPGGGWVDQNPVGVPGMRSVVVSSDRSKDMQLWVLDLEHKVPPRQLPSGDRDDDVCGNATVTGDATRIYAICNRGDLIVQPLDGSRPPERVAGKFEGKPAMRRDGSIVVTTRTGDRVALATVPAAGGAAVELVADADSPASSPASEDVYYIATAHREVMRRDARGNTRAVSSELPALQWRGLAVSQDGKRLAAFADGQLAVVQLPSGRLIDSYDAGASAISGATWLDDELAISYVDFQGDIWMMGR